MNFEKSADTKILESLLSSSAVGDTITYEQMSKAIGRDVRQHAISSLRSARRMLVSKGIVFGVENNVGVVRLDDSGILKSTESDRQRTRRIAKFSLRKLSAIVFEKLTGEERKLHIARSAQLGAVAMIADASSMKKIQSRVDPNQSVQLAIGETLKLFV